MFTNILIVVIILLIISLSITAITQNWSLIPPPRERDFGSALADWAKRRKLPYAPQQGHVISGVYNNRWFTIGTKNEENALRIRMRVNNLHRTSLQIFGDWLEDTGVIVFVNRFRVHSTPSGLSEKNLFDENTKLRDSRSSFPELRARLELFLQFAWHPHHLHYSLLTDLPGADTQNYDGFCVGFLATPSNSSPSSH